MKYVLDEQEVKKLKRIANETRATAVQMIFNAGSGHPGGMLSCADILTFLYEKELRIRPLEPDWVDRDRLVLSKGHACPILYAELARLGFFPEKLLMSLRRVGSILQGMPNMRMTPGVDMTTGSLGIGFSSAVGMALAAYMRKSIARIYVIIGDGEIAEGIFWEGALFAAHNSLRNLICFLDHNGFSSDTEVKKVLNVEPYKDKLLAFGWDVAEIDGHDFVQITKSLDDAHHNKRPTFIVAHTIKGKGVSYMENDPTWHGSLALSASQLQRALEDLGGINKEDE